MSNEITRDEKIALAESNIRKALEDYVRHINYCEPYDLELISDKFVHKLAANNYDSKRKLRELFRKSPAWNEELDCLVINGNRTHNPDPYKCRRITNNIIADVENYGDKMRAKDIDVGSVGTLAYHLALINAGDESVEEFQSAMPDSVRDLIRKIPGAYAPGKKPSRVIGAIFKALDFADNSAGSEYQKLFAQLADELNGKKIGFKLFVSLNPAHFLTMSNPKNDERGSTLTSCHSLNSGDYSYNNGTTGYARDNYSIIVFTAADPNNPETLNNRKTSRQMFFYRPDSGVLLQSRMYGTSGGIDGATEEGKLYRDLLQRELSELENVPNMWKTSEYTNNKYDIRFDSGYGFGGYCDWTYEYMHPMLSVRNDVLESVENGEFVPWEIGTFGLCPYCAQEHSEYFICDDCREPEYVCDCCGEGFRDEDDLTYVHGERICQDCLEAHYTWCEHCEEYYPNDDIVEVHTRWGNDYWCRDCAESDANWCYECEEYTTSDVIEVCGRHGNYITVCEECFEDHYCTCEDCGEYVHNDLVERADDGEGGQVWTCDECRDTCDECGTVYVRSVLNYRNAINGRHRCTCRACTEQVENNEFEYTEGEVIA